MEIKGRIKVYSEGQVCYIKKNNKELFLGIFCNPECENIKGILPPDFKICKFPHKEKKGRIIWQNESAKNEFISKIKKMDCGDCEYLEKIGSSLEEIFKKDETGPDSC